MTEHIRTVSTVLPILDLVASVGVLVGLFPLTGALAGIADPAFPLANALWFTAALGGAFVLLATGPKLLLGGTSSLLYVMVFAILLGAAGAFRLRSAGFGNLTYDWLVMAIIVGVLLLLLRHPSAWGIVGGLWSGLLLGAWSGIGIYSYLTTPTRIFSKLLPFQILASVLAIAVAVIHLRLRYGRR
jgi:hypothetical protein